MKEIKNALKAQEILASSRAYTAPQEFVILWVAWETLQSRIIVCGLKANGWHVKTSEQFLKSAKPNDLQDINKIFEASIGCSRDHLRARAGKAIRKIQGTGRIHERLRHRLIHGLGTKRPEDIQVAIEVLRQYLEDISWTKDIQIIINDEIVALESDVSRLPQSIVTQPIQSVSALTDWLYLRIKRINV